MKKISPLERNSSSRRMTSKVPIESPDNVEMGGKILSIRLCYAPLSKTIIRYASYVCTGFLMFLINLWIPSLGILMTYSDCDLSNAKHVVVYGADKNIEVVPLIKENTSEKTLKVFVYRLFKYFYDEEHETFKPAQFKIEALTFREIHQQFGQGLSETLVRDHATFFGKNLTNIPKKSCLSLMMQEVLSPFYIFQVYSIVVWSFDDYMVYAGIIIIFSAVSITITLYETIQTRSKLQKMSYYEIQVTVYRQVNGEVKKLTVNSSELVPGDVIEIPENAFMPCDVILLNGSCIMNESMLTGESIPVIKNSLPYSEVRYNAAEDKQYTLYAGTKCIQSRFFQGSAVLGLVTLTGFTTVKGELIRTMLFPKPTDFKFYSDSFKFISILAVMAITGFIIDLPSWIESGEDDLATMIIIKASEIVTVTVPPALPTCMQVGISIAIARLKKKQIYCISPSKINETGRVNVMCFDKTGTLTEDGLDLMGVLPVQFNKDEKKLEFKKMVKDIKTLGTGINEVVRKSSLSDLMSLEKNPERRSIYVKTGLVPSEQLLEIMAVCHSLTRVNNEMIGDPLDLKMFESTQWTFEENDNQKYDSLVLAVVKSAHIQPDSFATSENETSQPTHKEVGIVRRFEFSSKLQRMSVVVKNLNETGFKIHIKGSPEKIRELCKPESIPDSFHEILEKYTEDGYRVLSCATKSTNLNYMNIMSANREDIEKDFTFIGFLVMENRLKPITTQIIDTLHAAEIRTIMVTGDNVLTAISVARQCHIVGHYQRIFLGDLSEQKVDGKNTIVWKDFNYSERKLDDNLEPENTSGIRLSNAYDVSATEQLLVPSRESSARKSHEHHNAKARFNEQGKLALSNDISSGDSKEIRLLPADKLEISTPGKATDIESPPFFNMQSEEDYCIAVTGKAFSMILHQAEVEQNPHSKHIFQKLLRKCAVFARMHPDEKALMIKHMMTSNSKNIVGMCGDGANDVGALKTANVGVSLSEAEASIAAPFTSNIQDISCIPILLREGRAGLSTSYQAFKYMALYSIIQFTTVTILYDNLIELTNWAYYHIDIFIILTLSATMAMSESNEILTKFKPTGRLVSVQILISVIGQGFIQIMFQLGTYIFMVHQSWYGERSESNFDTQYACKENTTLYILTLYQYCMTAFVFIVGKPFRKPFYTNLWFTLSFVVLILLNLIMTFNPWNFQIFYSEDFSAESRDITKGWRTTLFIISVINSIITVLWEVFVVSYVSTTWKEYRNKKERLREAESNFYQPPPHPILN